MYLDFQAASPVRAEVLEAMLPYFGEMFGNPSSIHQYGLRARAALDNARMQVAELINAESPETIVFTSSGTESANLAVKGAAWASRSRRNHMVVSRIEHPAILRSADFLEGQGFQCSRVGVDSCGFVNPAEVRDAITDQTFLICIHHANHDIGTIEPIQEIGEIARERGIPLFVDATVTGGWIEIDVQRLGISLLSLSPHRFYGPKGVGVLYRNRRARLANILHGGAQEGGLRPGTENVPSIVGAGAAARLARQDGQTRLRKLKALQVELWNSLSSQIGGIDLNGPEIGNRRNPTNLNFSVHQVEGEALVLSLDMKGIAISSGPTCVGKALQISHVLEAIGLGPERAQSSVVISLADITAPQQINGFVEGFKATVRKLRGASPVSKPNNESRPFAGFSPGA